MLASLLLKPWSICDRNTRNCKRNWYNIPQTMLSFQKPFCKQISCNSQPFKGKRSRNFMLIPNNGVIHKEHPLEKVDGWFWIKRNSYLYNYRKCGGLNKISMVFFSIEFSPVLPVMNFNLLIGTFIIQRK